MRKQMFLDVHPFFSFNFLFAFCINWNVPIVTANFHLKDGQKGVNDTSHKA